MTVLLTATCGVPYSTVTTEFELFAAAIGLLFVGNTTVLCFKIGCFAGVWFTLLLLLMLSFTKFVLLTTVLGVFAVIVVVIAVLL